MLFSPLGYFLVTCATFALVLVYVASKRVQFAAALPPSRRAASLLCGEPASQLTEGIRALC
jgi:hypothetical protein